MTFWTWLYFIISNVISFTIGANMMKAHITQELANEEVLFARRPLEDEIDNA